MAQVETLAIIIPLLFVLLVQLIGTVRQCPIKTHVPNKNLLKTIDYGRMPFRGLAVSVAEILPTLGRWTTGMGRFGLLHMLTSYYVGVVVAVLYYLSWSEGNFLIVPSLAMGVFWILLPLFTVEEYDEIVNEDIKPRSIDYHTMMAIGAILLIYAIVSASRTVATYENVVLLVGFMIMNWYHYYLSGLYEEMLAREVDYVRNGGIYESKME